MGAAGAVRVTPPSSLWLLAEVRAVAEFWGWVLAQPLLRRAPHGDGHPVLVVPGFLASDVSTWPLRTFLRQLGYQAEGWGAGRNLGGPEQEEAVSHALLRLALRSGRKVSLVGWSLGGVYAREMARRMPDRVRQVITLGSPFTGDPRANHAWWIYERLSGRTASNIATDHPHLGEALPVPCSCLYSVTDGVTAWQCCRQADGADSENIQVPSSHLGYGHNPVVLSVIADRLAQPEDGWQPFEPRGVMRRLVTAQRCACESPATVA
jgi:pimeloyl-ACP methyl ester carboxylesterase